MVNLIFVCKELKVCYEWNYKVNFKLEKLVFWLVCFEKGIKNIMFFWYILIFIIKIFIIIWCMY